MNIPYLYGVKIEKFLKTIKKFFHGLPSLKEMQ